MRVSDPLSTLSAIGQKTTAMIFLLLVFPFLSLSAASSLHLNNDTMEMEMEVAGPLREKEMGLLEKGEKDSKTMVTYSIKVYVTPEVVAAYPNYTETVDYLIDIVNKQYKRSKIALKAKLHCIEKTKMSEADGMNDYDVFDKSKGSVEELRGSADLAALFVTELKGASGWAGGQVLACNLPESLRTRIVFGHELGHNFGAHHKDGFRFRAGGKERGTLMHTAESYGDCCHDEYGFYSNPELMIDGVPAGDKEHNSAAIIQKKRDNIQI